MTIPASRSDTPASLLAAAAELAELIGNTALQRYRTVLTVERKQDGSPVTRADREAEQQARDWLARRFPADAVLGEEFGERPGRSGRTWVLDPIDGTRSFIHGVPLWGSLVALVEREAVLAGAAVFPAVGETLLAAPGEGCWHNGARCRVSSEARLEQATLLTSDEYEYGFQEAAQRAAWERLTRQVGLVRTWGDCYGYLLVATGRAEIMADARLNPWDIACFLPILAEAGGGLTDVAGKTSWRITSALATNAALARPVRQLFEIR